jgi:hypothetical protein
LVSNLAYLSDIFEKFSTLNTSMQGNDINIIIVTAKVKAFIGKLGLWVRKVEGISLEICSCLKVSVEENSMEISGTRIDQCIKHQLVNVQSRFSKYFPEALRDKYKWIIDPFRANLPQNYNFSFEEEEEYFDIVSDTF